jgi:hypothetical protein
MHIITLNWNTISSYSDAHAVLLAVASAHLIGKSSLLSIYIFNNIFIFYFSFLIISSVVLNNFLCFPLSTALIGFSVIILKAVSFLISKIVSKIVMTSSGFLCIKRFSAPDDKIKFFPFKILFNKIKLEIKLLLDSLSVINLPY